MFIVVVDTTLIVQRVSSTIDESPLVRCLTTGVAIAGL